MIDHWTPYHERSTADLHRLKKRCAEKLKSFSDWVESFKREDSEVFEDTCGFLTLEDCQRAVAMFTSDMAEIDAELEKRGEAGPDVALIRKARQLPHFPPAPKDADPDFPTLEEMAEAVRLHDGESEMERAA